VKAAIRTPRECDRRGAVEIEYWHQVVVRPLRRRFVDERGAARHAHRLLAGAITMLPRHEAAVHPDRGMEPAVQEALHADADRQHEE
jgi:hypothetical protein